MKNKLLSLAIILCMALSLALPCMSVCAAAVQPESQSVIRDGNLIISPELPATYNGKTLDTETDDGDLENWKSYWDNVMEPAGWGCKGTSRGNALQVIERIAEDNITQTFVIRHVEKGTDKAEAGDQAHNACLGGAGGTDIKSAGISYTIGLSDAEKALANAGCLKLNVSGEFYREKEKNYKLGITVEYIYSNNTCGVGTFNEINNSTDDNVTAGGYQKLEIAEQTVPEGVEGIRFWFANYGTGNERKGVKNMQAFFTNTAEYYNLEVGGVQVSDLNARDILGSADGDGATASYDPDTNTLTLNGFVSAEQISSNLSALNIVLIGNNTINYAGLHAIYSTGALSLGGRGNLTVSGERRAISAERILTIEDCTVNATAMTNSDAIAIVGGHGVQINNAAVTAIGKEYGIDSYGMHNGIITINSGSVIAQAETTAFGKAVKVTQDYSYRTSAAGSYTEAVAEDAATARTGAYYEIVVTDPLHIHCICGAADCSDHGGAVTYATEWSGTYSDNVEVSEDSYIYLSDDVTMEGAYTDIIIGSYALDEMVHEPIVKPATAYLCLNGHTLNGSINILEGSTLYICDCAEAKGRIINEYGENCVINNGNLTLDGVRIIQDSGSEVRFAVNNQGNLTVKGDSYLRCMGGAALYNAYATINLYGGTFVSDTLAIRNEGENDLSFDSTAAWYGAGTTDAIEGEELVEAQLSAYKKIWANSNASADNEAFTTTTDGGYYGEVFDNPTSGIVVFNSFYSKYNAKSVSKFGMFLYLSGKAEVRLEASNADELITNSGAFYASVSDIPTDQFDTYIFGKPYVVIDGKVYYGNTASTTVNSGGKWLGGKGE